MNTKRFISILTLLYVVFLSSTTYPMEPFSLYGVQLGDTLEQVVKNGLERGYKIKSTFNNDEMTALGVQKMGLVSNSNNFFFTFDYQLRIIPNINIPSDKNKQEWMDRYFSVLKTDKDTGLVEVAYSGAKIPNVRIYLYEPKDGELRVFSIMSVVGKDAVPVFTEKYGETKIHGVNNMTIDVWKNGNDVASVSNINGEAFLCNVQTYGEVYSRVEAILDSLAQKSQEKQEKEQQEELKRKKAEI